MVGMTDDLPKRRWFWPTPGWLVVGLLVVEGLLWLSERFQWPTWHKGYAVLIAVAAVGATFVLMLLWLVASLPPFTGGFNSASALSDPHRRRGPAVRLAGGGDEEGEKPRATVELVGTAGG